MAEDNKLPSAVKWIQTPFAYTNFSKNLTLFQQNILVKVSLYMQQYWENYWNTDLRNSKERPKPLLSASDVISMKPIRLSLKELGLTSNNYSRINEAMNEILAITVDVPREYEEGMEIVKYNLFSHGKTPVNKVVKGKNEVGEEIIVDRRRGYIDLLLNPNVVNYAFDMSQGYVSHPEDIARIGKAENMPQMYYLIKHHMNNWKKSNARIDLIEIKDYLGMVKRDENSEIIKVSYKKYSQFRTRILKKTMDEMHELYLKGKIDKDFEWTELRERGKKTGDPIAIIFAIAKNKEQKLSLDKGLFTEVEEIETTEPHRSWLEIYAEQHGDPTTAIGQKAWDNMCSQIQDEEKRGIFQSVRVEKISRKALYLYGEKDALDSFDSCLKNMLDVNMQNWVFCTITKLAEHEVKSIKYHYPSC